MILLVLLAGKYRDTIQVIPSVAGFFMYQVRDGRLKVYRSIRNRHCLTGT